MQLINGNILYLTDAVIVHQVNRQHVAGAGLALHIREHFTGWYKHFKQISHKLGGIDTWFYPRQNIYVVSFYSQDHYGLGKRQTDSTAFANCLLNLHAWITANHKENMPIYFPYKIGCGLAGGNWETISALIAEVFPDANIIKL